MTGNVVLLGVGIATLVWHQSFRHLPPILLFLLGIWAARSLQLPAVRRRLPTPYPAVLAIEIVILFILALLPEHTPDFWITSSIAFALLLLALAQVTVPGHSRSR